jgi:hypothetical protein
MTTDQSQPTLTHGPSDGEILRLRQELAARDEAIRQLNHLVHDQPSPKHTERPEPDQDELATAVAAAKALKVEIGRLQQLLALRDEEIAGLRRAQRSPQAQQSPPGPVVASPSLARSIIRRVRAR